MTISTTENIDLIPATWAQHIADWTDLLKAANRSPGTIYLRTYHVRRLATHFPAGPATVTVQELASWLAEQSWGAETRRSHRASWAVFYTWAQAAGRVETNPAKLLPTVAVPAGRPRPAPENVFRRALMRANDRERLMLMLAANAGLRRAEIAAVHQRDVQPDLAGWSLRVRGKGGKLRVVPLSTGLAELLLEVRGHAFPGQVSGHLSPAHVGKILSRVLGEGWTAHTLRHRFASRAYAAERDLRAVQELLGHSKPETTARYTLVPQEAARRAVDAAAA